MFAKLAFFASLALLAIATPTPGAEPASSCNTGPIQCCNSVQGSEGLGCTPVTVIGTGSSGCSANPVCCDNFNGLVFIGCVPVDLSL